MFGDGKTVMATLPPRKNATSANNSKQQLTPLQILLQLGFPKHRAEKALAATGHRGVQLASDWLLAHVRDPTLDSATERQYALYVCPTSTSAERLFAFWNETKELGWNGAHNIVPHITLVSFFNAPDECAEELVNILESVIEKVERPDKIELETYMSPNFMGLFVNEKIADRLKSIAAKYVERLSEIGIQAEAQTKSLHLTLAYQFPGSHFQDLGLMVEKLVLEPSDNWELRLYSRDTRLQGADVHKVMHAHNARQQDELELRVGDYIYIAEGACDASTDGWVEGVSWLTGTTGYLPLNHTERTAKSDSWTLHASLRITEQPEVTSAERVSIPYSRKQAPLLSTNNTIDVVDGVSNDTKPKEASSASSLDSTSRQIFICRHGERVDFTFGTWIPYCFDANGSYVRRDLNMPKALPHRNIQDFQHDSPLTTVGELQATLVGEAMLSSQVVINFAYASPSLRCVQTLSRLLQGLNSDLAMKIEPGLIEWLAWYPNGAPVWMNVEELTKAGFKVDQGYKPIVKTENLPLKENAAQYYERSFELVKRIIDGTVGNILIVAHAASLAACTRQLTGGKIPPAAEVTKLVQRVPYLACLMVKQDEERGWELHPPPFPPITHTANGRFDWKVLM